MSNKSVIALAFSVTAILLSLANLIFIIHFHAKHDVQYVVYLGTNHKDTNEAVFTAGEAKLHADMILAKYFQGFTIQEANGGWVENGVVSHEYTLVIYLSDTNLDQVHKACDELINKFSQSSVLIQANSTKTEFYSGK